MKSAVFHALWSLTGCYLSVTKSKSRRSETDSTLECRSEVLESVSEALYYHPVTFDFDPEVLNYHSERFDFDSAGVESG